MPNMDEVHKAVNLVGSVASIIALVVLIVGSFSSEHDAETLLWQYAFFGISLVVSAVICVLFSIWIISGVKKHPLSTARGIMSVGLKLCFGLVALGLAGDGMISAINWTYWPYIPATFVETYWRHIFH